MDSMFEILMGLPLLKGVSAERMEKTVGSSKFHFLKYPPGETVFHAGDPCTDIAFILAGTVKLTIRSADGRFAVSQLIDGRDVISPDFLFGRKTNYPGDVIAHDTVSILRIPKSDYINILTSDHIFLFNYLNLLSMNAQKSVERILAVSSGDVAERIAYWISAMTQPRSHGIVLECSRRDLTTLFNTPRSVLKAALEDMKARGLVDYTPHSITVTDRQALIALLHDHPE